MAHYPVGWKWWLIVAVLVVVLAFAATPLALRFAGSLVDRKPLAMADAAAVLAGDYPDRMPYAALLYKNQRIKKILLTNEGVRAGWSNPDQRLLWIWERAKRSLVGNGVERDDIELIPKVIPSGTHSELEVIRDYAVEHNIRSLVLVTSAYHTRRTWFTAQRVFRGTRIDIGVDAPPLVLAAHRNGTILKEYVKLLYYYLRFSWE